MTWNLKKWYRGKLTKRIKFREGKIPAHDQTLRRTDPACFAFDKLSGLKTDSHANGHKDANCVYVNTNPITYFHSYAPTHHRDSDPAVHYEETGGVLETGG
jgi:hypothetical protein